MHYDNPVVRFLNKLTDLLVLNLLFLLCSLPIVTMGAALTAMYAVNLRSVRDGDGYVVSRFFRAFKENFRQATVCWLIVLGTALLLFVDVVFWQRSGMGEAGRVMMIASIVIAVFLWIVSIWLFPVLAKMRDRLKIQIRNAVKLALGFFLPHTLICMLIQALAVYLTLHSVGFMMLMLVFGIAMVSWICSFFIYRAFARVIREDPVGQDDLLYPEKEETEAGVRAGNDFRTRN